MMRSAVCLILLLITINSYGQQKADTSNTAANKWADSVLKTLSNEERIAQLMIVRLSAIDLKTRVVTFYDDKVAELVKKYNVGAVCLFQGSPVKQANMVNALQKMAKTPLMMCIDGEWGVGMRIIDSVLPLPKQMMLGAMKDETIVYKYGQVVAEQCKRLGIHVNYAPVVDVNNNPNNPVINDRSFGEDKYKVAKFGIQYMKGMQDMGVMACAKHFPGHGDVAVDSHLDLPVINKTKAQLDSLELYPFRQIFDAGIASAMVAHLYIPAIDNRPNRATSLSKANVNDLMRNELHFSGLTFTDALEMQGVKKFFPNGDASVESLIAGNDMLCLPDDVPMSIAKIKEAVANKKLSWEDIEMHCRKVLVAKYMFGVAAVQPINTSNLTVDLNSKIPAMTRLVAENAITLLAKKDAVFFPLTPADNNKAKQVAYIGIGINNDNAFATRMRKDYNASVFYFDHNSKDPAAVAVLLKKIAGYKKVVIGIHNLGRTAATNFGLSSQDISLVNQIQKKNKAITFLFGNAYAVKNFCNIANLVVCYEDDTVIQQTAVDMLEGKLPYKGAVPVTVCEKYKFGSGFTAKEYDQFGFDKEMANRVDSIVDDAISKQAMPGCVVLVAKDGRIAYNKAYGNYTYDSKEPVNLSAIYDVASMTKICATTISVMRLYEEGKIDLKKKLGDYLPSVIGTNKESLSIEKLLLHQAGLVAYIPFYKEIIDTIGVPLPGLYQQSYNDSFAVRVADHFFLRKDIRDTLYQRILTSSLGPEDRYVYSDNDFIFLGMIVEQVSSMRLDEYVRKTFYSTMSLESAGFLPRNHFLQKRIVPTEDEKQFRRQLIRGDVHDPVAAMMGGVAGHAGMFSDAYDIASLMQMLLNGGQLNGKRYLQKETVDLFTSYHSKNSRRGYGFDKPEKDNNRRPDPYPAASASSKAFGHTGFTGTCAWADPEHNLVFVLLSNRVNPSGSELFNRMNIRPKIYETIYQSLSKK